MDDPLKTTYQSMSNPYCQTLPDHPAVNVVIQDSGIQIKKSTGNEQQKFASQRPRGTRIDETGTRIQVKGGRNYTSRKLFISREEMFDDVVVRGLRADGLSTKLGVKNHKDGIRKMLSELFQEDSRLPIIEEHFRTHRQKSNCAKTMFATMTHEELQFLKAETFPSRIDVQVRDYLTNAFSEQPQKLQATVEVLGQVQQIFKALTPHADFLSSHNFQTRGFFLDIILMTCSFLMQIIQDTDGNPEPTSNDDAQSKISNNRDCEILTATTRTEEKNKTAAEILLSVGSDILDSSDKVVKPSVRVHNRSQQTKRSKLGNTEQSSSNNTNTIPTTIVVEGSGKPDDSESEEWTTVEMVDANGNARYVLIKTNNEDGETFDTMKILNLLQSQGVNLDEKLEVSMSSQNASDERPKRVGNDYTHLEEILRGGNQEELVIDMETEFQEDSEEIKAETSTGTRAGKENTTKQHEALHCSVIPLQEEEISGVEIEDDILDSGTTKESQKRPILSTTTRFTRKRPKVDEDGGT